MAEQMTLNQRVVGSSPTRGNPACSRQDASKGFSANGLRQPTHAHRSSQQATENNAVRPLRATRVATPLLPDDPDLAAVVVAWPDLPDALRAGILAIIKAAAPPHA